MCKFTFFIAFCQFKNPYIGIPRTRALRLTLGLLWWHSIVKMSFNQSFIRYIKPFWHKKFLKITILDRIRALKSLPCKKYLKISWTFLWEQFLPIAITFYLYDIGLILKAIACRLQWNYVMSSFDQYIYSVTPQGRPKQWTLKFWH